MKLSTGTIKGLIIGGVLLLVVLIIASMWIGYSNEEKALRVDFSNAQRASQVDFDNMWKTIQQKYQIKGDYEDTLKGIFAEMARGREGGSLFKSVTESIPGLDTTVYRELMATIEGKRNQFQSYQLKLSDLKAQHDKLLSLFPGSLFVGGRPPLQIKLVTSARTESAFESGQDNDVDLRDTRKPVDPERK